MKLNIKTIRRILGICIVIIIIILIASIITRNMNSGLDEVNSIDNIIGKTAKRKYVKIEDKNGAIFYLPKGFRISDNPEEQIVDEGLVIIDNTGDKETNGSEFIWIPVEDIDKAYNYDRNTDELLLETQAEDSSITEEYINIRKSITTYGGFYISRYEAGISEKLKSELEKSKFMDEKQNILKDTTEDWAKEKYKPISKPNSTVWNFIQWGGSFKEKASDGLAGNDEKNGAVKVARSMYEKSKTSVKSNLCYGFQWDAIMNFIDPNYYSNTCDENSVIVDSSEYGNYNNALRQTASDGIYSQKNIFDLSGNVWEWTMEGSSNSYRITRGGSYVTKGNMYSISSEEQFYPSDNFKDIGFRVALWIK